MSSIASTSQVCTCKNTCSTKDGAKKKGCPCKTSGRFCSDDCTCGGSGKRCSNREDFIPKRKRPRNELASQDLNRSKDETETQNPLTLPEEEEARLENNQVKEFISTLDADMVHRLAVQSLQKGVGSMDYVQSLMVRIYDVDDSANEEIPPMSLQDISPSRSPTRQEPVPDWCKCGCCFIMPQAVENKCCNYKKCVTKTRRFKKLCLDPEYLQLSCRNVGEIRNDRQDNSTRAFRKQAYRHYILDTHGYLGKGRRRVAPSCVVNAIRKHYPSPTGVYMGFREH